jgi:fructose-1,6-bisphosphatase/inositol monophosphatase family enzyme
LNLLTAALYDKELAPLKGKFARVTRLGCAGKDYWAAVEGAAHVVSFRNLKAWDHAPGLLIHAEAGGYARLLNGEAYAADRLGQTSVLCTPTREIWQRVLAARQAQT